MTFEPVTQGGDPMQKDARFESELDNWIRFSRSRNYLPRCKISSLIVSGGVVSGQNEREEYIPPVRELDAMKFDALVIALPDYRPQKLQTVFIIYHLHKFLRRGKVAYARSVQEKLYAMNMPERTFYNRKNEAHELIKKGIYA